MAGELGCVDLHLVSQLRESGIDWTAKNALNESPLTLAVFRSSPDLLRYLLEMPEVLSQCNLVHYPARRTALHLAAMRRDVESMKVLMATGLVDPLATDFLGHCAFSYAQGHRPSQRAMATPNPDSFRVWEMTSSTLR